MRKKEVLRGKRDFNRVYSKGKSVRDRYLVLIYLKNGLPYTRTAFLASKKVGNSVQRNRAKRLMKESYRVLSEDIKEGYDLVMIARTTINGKKCDQIRGSLKKSLEKAHVLGKHREAKEKR